METYKIPPSKHAANLAALDRVPTQPIPLLGVSVYDKSDLHEIMLFDRKTVSANEGFDGCQPGCLITFVCVKGIETWAAFYMIGAYSPEHVSENGQKLTKEQTMRLIHCEGNLIEKYRN
jgi:hypothetical protein